MALTKVLVKGQALDAAEHDGNLDYLNDRPDGQTYPKEAGVGIKIDTAAPDWGWHDLYGEVSLDFDASDPSKVTYQGGIKQWQFDVGDDLQVEFHLPHDYVPGTDLQIHVHWSHNSTLITTGVVTWQAEVMYAKGHNQAFFSTPITVNIGEAASTIRYQHMITEVQLSAALGAGGLLDTGEIEVDGLAIVRLSLLSNTMDGGAKPFMHRCDLHYQSSGLPTKNRIPNFYGV